MPKIDQPRSPITGEVLTSEALEIAAQDHGIELASTSVGRMFDMGAEKLAAKKRQASLTRKAEGETIEEFLQGAKEDGAFDWVSKSYLMENGGFTEQQINEAVQKGLLKAMSPEELQQASDDAGYDVISEGGAWKVASVKKADAQENEGYDEKTADAGWSKTSYDPEAGDKVRFDNGNGQQEGICTQAWDEGSDYCKVKLADGSEEIVHVNNVIDVFTKTASIKKKAKKYLVTGTSEGVTRDEEIDTATNTLFKNCENEEDIKEAYEAFWGGTVRVLKVKPLQDETESFVEKGTYAAKRRAMNKKADVVEL